MKSTGKEGRSRAMRRGVGVGILTLAAGIAFAALRAPARVATRAEVAREARGNPSEGATRTAASARLLVPPAPAPTTLTTRPVGGREAARKDPDPTYDARSFQDMAKAWEDERDDPEWSVNMKTFIGALLDTVTEDAAVQSASMRSVRCRHSVCRIDADAENASTLALVLESSRNMQAQVAYQLHSDDGGVSVEAYVGKELAAPADAQ